MSRTNPTQVDVALCNSGDETRARDLRDRAYTLLVDADRLARLHLRFVYALGLAPAHDLLRLNGR
ncbi:MAG: hypothetical protein KAI47_05375 [Deltaproteobacteria bacterium]|nr:hypothetical protein [Deltaproteobacteria bacterium]